MENNVQKPVVTNHTLFLKDRKELLITGVKNIKSFDSLEFLIETHLGVLHILGHSLVLGKMDSEGETIEIRGNISSFAYLQKETPQEKESFFKKLFKWLV